MFAVRPGMVACICLNQTNEFRLTGSIGEFAWFDEEFRFQINRANFRKLQRIEDLDEFSKMFD